MQTFLWFYRLDLHMPTKAGAGPAPTATYGQRFLENYRCRVLDKFRTTII